ncbi:hypothetical protein Golomagni_04417 [Golovinomyces magnicellulatus]|nr:hypothetical protein Golomagni_04417 [Golovinomyces magnicellulatus]
MAFLFKSKKNADKTQLMREGPRPVVISPATQPHANPRTNEKNAGFSTTPGSSVNNSITSLQGSSPQVTPSPEQANSRRGMPSEQAQDFAQRNGAVPLGPPTVTNPNASLYPWSRVRLNYTTALPGPFPRYGAAVNSVASKDGGIYLMGGLINGSTVKGDLWMIEAFGNMSCYPLATTSEGPGPRVGHASLLVGNAFIVYGGDTKIDDSDTLDETLYLLNTATRQWSRAIPAGPRPTGRYGHSLNILGSKIYVFGGQVEGYFMNDLVAFDLNMLQVPTNRWEMLLRNSDDGGPPAGKVPSPRTNHSTVTYNEKLYLFGGTNGQIWFNDVWCYDPIPNAWFSLDCIGYIPVPREGHAATIVDDVMYVFGGRAEDGTDLGDLAAFRISSRRWYTFQNMGPSPSSRSGHSMTAYGKHIIVLAGEPSTVAKDSGDLSIAYLLDTSKIRYPNDHPPQHLPERNSAARRPSISEMSRTTSNRGLVNRDTLLIDNKRANEMIGRGGTQPNDVSSPVLSPGQQSLAAQVNSINSKSPKASAPQTSNGPPILEHAPPPRSNSATPTASGRSKLYSRYEAGHSCSVDISPRSTDMNLSTSPPKFFGTSQTKDTNKEKSIMAELKNSENKSPPLTKSTLIENDQPVGQKNAGSVSIRSPSRTRVNPQQGSSDSTSEQTPFRNGSSARPTSPPPSSRVPYNPLVRKGSTRNSQTVSLLKELDATKNKNAWYASELELARKLGYTPSTSNSLDQKSIESFDDDDKPLIEALISMRTELLNVQESVDQQSTAAAKQIAEVEKQRDSAIKEAIYAKAKLAACKKSQSTTPSPDNESSDLENLTNDRTADLSRKLAAAITEQSQIQSKNNSLISELVIEQRSRKLAEEIASSSQNRITELETCKQQNSIEIERLKAELHKLQASSRKEAVDCTEALASAKLIRAEKEDLQIKYENAITSTQSTQQTFDTLRSAVESSLETQEVLQRQLDDERAQREIIEGKLSRLRSEHENCTNELEITTKRLKDAEELLEANTNESRNNWQAIKLGLDQIASRGTDLPEPASEQKIIALEAQAETANALARKYQADADIASEKLRSAEERIAGLEAYQEQASREGMFIRKQLLSTTKEIQTLQSANNELKLQVEYQQLETNAVSVQHSTLKEILNERGMGTSNSSRARGLSSPSSALTSPDLAQIRELEQQLSASIGAHEETKQVFEAREKEVERSYREKLTQLDNDYQTAVKYVKGTEKMLKRLNDELAKYKVDNIRLKDQLAEAEKKLTAIHGPTGWEEERAELKWRNESLQEEIKTSVKKLEQKIGDVRRELLSTEQERDELKHDQEETRRRAQVDLSQLQKENAQLQQQVQEAEQKVSLLLDQVEQSVDIYRRHSRPVETNGTTPSATSNILYHRGLLVTDSASDTSYEGGNRNSMALDSLASELETLRSHWQNTNKNYRLSNAFDIDDRTTPMKS